MSNKTITNLQILKLLEGYRSIWAIGHVQNLADWDMNTYMPKKGVEARGEAESKLASLSQQLFTEKKFVQLVEKAETQSNLNDAEKGIVREIRRNLNNYQKLPSSFVEEFARVTSVAHSVWVKAKKEQNFSIFQPYLEKIVELTKQRTEYYGYTDHPYDALLDIYEEGLTTKEVENFFDSYRSKLKDILKKVLAKGDYESIHPLEKAPYNKAKMVELGSKVLDYLQADRNVLRLDVSAHPFTIGIASPYDVRITTRYAATHFSESLLSTVHEFGHALYEMQINPDLAYTPIGSGVSLGLHESQSRFWENMIGCSQNFTERFLNDFKTLSPEIKIYLDEHGSAGVYKYLNMVKPDFIRVEADEITYHFHIMLRFEIEKGLVTGDIKVKDLPEVWNAKMKEYLGVIPPNDSKGVLQDVHWSTGSIGYFATYSTGSFLSAMWLQAFEKEHGAINTFLVKPEAIVEMHKWLKKNLHQYGATYTFKDLIKKSLGSEFVVEPMLKYLEKKYL